MERADFTRGAIVDEEECIAALDAYLARYPSPVLALVRERHVRCLDALEGALVRQIDDLFCLDDLERGGYHDD